MAFPNSLTPEELAELIAILGRLGSDFDGERAAAGLIASRMLQSKGLTWADVVGSPQIRYTPPPSSPTPKSPAELLAKHRGQLSDWEIGFLTNLSQRRGRLTPKQEASLASIRERVAR
jgi:hypothetical protein